MSTNDGGQAFPTENVVITGMSLLDYFAGQVVGAVSGDYPNWDTNGGDGPRAHKAVEIAKDAYAIADAMLAERSKRR